MPTLNSLLLERKVIEDGIIKKEAEINGTSLSDEKNEIDILVSKRFAILSDMDYQQKKARNNSDKEELIVINSTLEKLCTELSEIDNLIKEKNADLKFKENQLFSKSDNSKREELVKLYEKLSDNTEKVGKKREEERLLSKVSFVNSDGYEQIWIDQTFGAYIWYNKKTVIEATIKDIFNFANNIDNVTLNQAGYENGLDTLFSSISNPNLPGLPSLLSMGIDLLIKTIGSFVKNFIAIKNAIDMLAGMDIADIIGTCIPAAMKIMEDIKLFLSDTPAWMFKNMLSPIYGLNIPIPAFSFDLGAIIPALPFMINIPKIDNLDIFTKLTPISIKCGDTDVEDDWYKEKQNDEDKIKNINADNYNSILNDLQNRINKLNSDITVLSKENNKTDNNDEIKKLDDEIKNREALLCSNSKTMTDIQIDKEVMDINELYNKKKEYENTKVEVNNDEKIQDIKNEIKKLETKKKTLLKVIASSLSVSNNISEDKSNSTLDSLLKIGVNVNDNNNLLYIQKIGYNFKNDDHIEKLKSIKTKGIDISDTKHLKRLFDIGFNINDPKFLDKLNDMNKYGIDVKNTEILYMLCDIGFNLNNKKIFDYIKILTESNIFIGNFDTIFNINNIGFNFNNPLAVDRLYKLSGIVDLTDNKTFDMLIQKNINLNNPYFSTILELYNSIGIKIGGVDMKQKEDEIFLNVDYKKIDEIINLIDVFKINDYSYRAKYYTNDVISFVSGFTKLSLIGDIATICENEITKNGYLSIFTVKSVINKYSKYGLVFSELKNETNIETIKTDTSVYQRYVMFRDYVKNKKFVINGNNINETITEDDMVKLSELYGFSFTNNINPLENELNSAVLGSIFGNFDKIGLNSKDPEFNIKIKSFTDSFKLKLDEIAVLDTKKNVYMETKLKKNKLGGYTKGKTNKIDLSKTKIDPELLEDDSATFITENVLEDGKPLTTKTIAKFDSINKMGFNYQQPDYSSKINILKKYGYDISHYDTPSIIENLSVLGFHLTDSESVKKLDYLGDLGFKFNVPKIKSKIKTNNNNVIDFFTQGTSVDEPQYTEVVVSANISILINLGFNFNKDRYTEMLNFLKSVGINLSSEDCQEALNEINSFGINFNDINWEIKTEFFKKLNIDFSLPNWQDKMGNIRYLGLDFNGDKWQDNYNSIESKRSYGLDYNDTDLRKKLSILTDLGIDFSEAPDIYKEKVEALIDLGLVSLSSDLFSQRKNEYSVYLKKQKYLESLILLKKDELNDKDIMKIKDEIYLLNANNSSILSEIEDIKKLLNISQNEKTLETYGLKLTEYCSKLSENEKKIKEKNDTITDIIKNKDYEKIKKELDELTIEYNGIKKPKPYKKDGYKIMITSLDKIQRFDEMNVSFLKENWNSDIQSLLKSGMNFSDNNWEEKSNELKELVQPCPQLAWLKMIKKVFKTIITAPVNMIFGLVKQLLNLVKSIVSLPLNPVKIPDFAKTIISNFKGFIKMMMKLPSLQGIIDFLFLDLMGLKMIDMFLPGFADFFQKIQKKNKNCSENAPEVLNNKLKALKLQLAGNKLEKQNKVEDANDKKQIHNAIINKKNDNYLQILLSKRDTINNNMETIKEKSKSEKNLDTLKSLENEINKLCSEITEIDVLIRDYEMNRAKITPNEAQKNINDIDNQLNSDIAEIDAKMRKTEDSIKATEAEIKESGCSKCFCCISDKEAVEMFKGLSDDIKNEKNLSGDKLKDNENKIKKLEEKINSNTTNPITKNVIDNEIKKKEAELCLINSTLSDIEKDKLINEINDLYNISKEIDVPTSNDIDVDSINKQIDELKKENSKLKEESDKFEKDRKINLINLEGIMKFIPVIKNIICYTPKFIANIIIGIFNSAGYMKNLPILWEFPLIE